MSLMIVLDEPGSGTKLPTIHVIEKCLEFLKNEALNEINKASMKTIKMEDIQWVLTVPAIWTDKAKVR